MRDLARLVRSGVRVEDFQMIRHPIDLSERGRSAGNRCAVGAANKVNGRAVDDRHFPASQRCRVAAVQGGAGAADGGAVPGYKGMRRGKRQLVQPAAVVVPAGDRQRGRVGNLRIQQRETAAPVHITRHAPRVFQVKAALGAADRPASVAVHRRQRDGGAGARAMAHRRMRDAQRSGGCRQGLRAGSGRKVTQGRAVCDACRVDGAGQRREQGQDGVIIAHRTAQRHAPSGKGFIRYRDKSAFLGGGEGIGQDQIAVGVHGHVFKVDGGMLAVVDEGPRLAGEVKGGAVNHGDDPRPIRFRGAAHVKDVGPVVGDQSMRGGRAHSHLARAVVDAAGDVDGSRRSDLANLAAAGVGMGESRYRALADDAAHDPILSGGARRYGKAGVQCPICCFRGWILVGASLNGNVDVTVVCNEAAATLVFNRCHPLRNTLLHEVGNGLVLTILDEVPIGECWLFNHPSLLNLPVGRGGHCSCASPFVCIIRACLFRHSVSPYLV